MRHVKADGVQQTPYSLCLVQKKTLVWTL